ncbi:hypothetical protein [Hydrogenimonas sp.]
MSMKEKNIEMLRAFDEMVDAVMTFTISKREIREAYMTGYLTGTIVEKFDAYSPWEWLIVKLTKRDGVIIDEEVRLGR